MSEESTAEEKVKSSIRRPSDFAFRVWDGQTMMGWGVARQTAFNVNVEHGRQPLMYRIFTDPDFVLMQLTPWLDRHGNSIYEGDVLEFDSAEFGGDHVCVMEWVDGEWSHTGVHSDLSQWCTVIGNIHENPELLDRIKRAWQRY